MAAGKLTVPDNIPLQTSGVQIRKSEALLLWLPDYRL
jgi:hypothetical protein